MRVERRGMDRRAARNQRRTKRASGRRLGLISAVIPFLLAGCSEERSDYSGPAPASGPVVTAPPAPPLAPNIMNALTPAWSTSGDANSVSLVLNDVGAGPPSLVLSMTYVRGAVLAVRSPRLVPEPNQDQLTIRAGAVTISLPVVSSPESDGIRAEGPAFRQLLGEITVGRQISLSHGAQSLGPLPPAPPPMISRFVSRCRQYLEPRGW